MKDNREEEIIKDLAEVLRKHRVAICSKKVGDYTEVFLQFHDRREGLSHIATNIELERCHVTAYDLTGEQ